LLISILELYEFPLSDRKFTWSKSIHSDSFALLDRFFYTLSWSSHFNACVVKSLLLVQSHHTHLILYSNKHIFHSNLPIRFEKCWLQKPGFIDLFRRWWNSCILSSFDVGEFWRLKLHIIRKKLKGWSLNLKAEKKKNRKFFQEEINKL
jgi:hypothetical protein